MHLRNLSASRKAGFVPAVSDLALIILAAIDESFAHDGMSPQRTSDNSRTGFFGFWRMTGDRLGGGDVEARTPVWFVGHAIEVLFNDLLSPRKSVASAHWEIMADRKNRSAWT